MTESSTDTLIYPALIVYIFVNYHLENHLFDLENHTIEPKIPGVLFPIIGPNLISGFEWLSLLNSDLGNFWPISDHERVSVLGVWM